MTTTRFDPEPDTDYGRCTDCGSSAKAKEDASAHMRETFETAQAAGGSSGHSVRVMNPGRSTRILNEVSRIIDDAITAATGNLFRLVFHDDATDEEITEAVSCYDDFADAWRETLEENR